jgi:hypothetical protein
VARPHRLADQPVDHRDHYRFGGREQHQRGGSRGQPSQGSAWVARCQAVQACAYRASIHATS